MAKIAEKEMETIRKTVEAEFPNDPALQQVHIARKIVTTHPPPQNSLLMRLYSILQSLQIKYFV